MSDMSSLPGEIEIVDEVGHVMASISVHLCPERVVQLIEKGGSVVWGFRQADMRLIAEDVFNFSGRIVTPNQVHNHMRHWRVCWIRVLRIKRLETVCWVEESSSLIMDDDDYYVHIKTRPSDTKLINKPIGNYAQMKIIYGPRIPVVPVSVTVIHRALTHLMEHTGQATMYLAMTPKRILNWFTTFLNKHHL